MLELCEWLQVHLGGLWQDPGQMGSWLTNSKQPRKDPCPLCPSLPPDKTLPCSRTWGWVVRAVSFYLLEGEAAKYFPDIEKSREYMNIEICPWHLHKLSTILNDLVFHHAQLSISDFKQTLFREISKMSSYMHDVFTKWNRTKAFRIVKKKKKNC